MTIVNKELRIVLCKLDDDALFSLAKTVTQGLKRSETVDDAVENIIKYSPDSLSILRRKVVTREILFNYLDENKIKIKLPATKNELIDSIADYWNISRIGVSHSNTQNDVGLLRQQSENNSTDVEHCDTAANSSIEKRSTGESNVNLMAGQFSKWFYSMLNANECGSEHFFPDASLKLNMYSNGDCQSTEIEGDPEEICQALLNLRHQNNLHFNPNDTQDGIQGRMDPHGLVLVLACGTLHIQSICAGVFEQVFSLARDPFSDNNWKIKKTQLNLRSKSNVLEAPKLCEIELTNELLMLPSE